MKAGERCCVWVRLLGVLWALPVSAPAFVCVVLLYPSGTRWARVRYGSTTALVAWGGWLRPILAHLPLGAMAGMTLGQVVLLNQRWAIRPIGAHEFEHVRQYLRWGGLFVLANGVESLWQWGCGRHYYWDNRFEVAAYRYERTRFERR